MWDIYAGIGIIVAVSILFFAFTRLISSRFPRRVADGFAVLTMLLMCLYIYFLWDQAEVVWLVPYSNAIIIGNWFPVITAMLSALVYRRVPPRSPRKYWVVILLNLVGFFALVQPILGKVPESQDEVDDFQIARQSTQVSCSPTSAVNLLAFYDVPARESEMVRLCLTRRPISWLGIQISEGGTSWLGLYRGLKIKLRETPYEPRFFNWSHEQFAEAQPEKPVIVSLMLDPELETTQPELHALIRQDGWQPGVEHNVVYFRYEGDRVKIIDPKVGLETMPVEWFRQLWVGRGIYLQKVR